MKSPEQEKAVPVTVNEAGPEDAEAIESLAGDIWREAYPGIISRDQIEYMLDRMYAPPIIRRQMEEEGIHYLKLVVWGDFCGFAAFGPGPEKGHVFLHKLYLRNDRRGQGYGSQLLLEVEERAFDMGATRIDLRVNRDNAGAIEVYERHGFTRTGQVCSDIGGGFLMDDFIMTKEIA